jgi:hypothetical protein
MFGSTVLDVAIGMVFVYLLLSLLCSAVNEYMEATLNYRAKNLQKGIQLLLDGEIAPQKTWLIARAISYLKETFGVAPPPKAAPSAAKNASTGSDAATTPPAPTDDGATKTTATGDESKTSSPFSKQLYEHGLIRALYQDAGRLPSYIPSRTFALALWNIASQKIKSDDPNKLVNPNDPAKPPTLQQIEGVIRASGLGTHLQQALITMIDEADGNFNRAVKNIEDWYDSSMDRVSGWYKRHVQWILLVTGIIVASLINADTVNIAKSLIQDKTLRDVIVASATEYAKENGASAASPETKKGGADTNTNSSNSNSSNSTPSNSNSSGTSGANSNARRERDTKAGNANANNTNTNGVNTNTATGGGEQSGNANTQQSNSNDGAKAGSTGGAPNPTPSPAPSSNPIQQAYEKINTLGLPIGWKLGSNITQDAIRGFPRRGEGGWNILSWFLLKLFGLFLTGLAISQGAPFWFDILNKFMVIRSTVKPKEKSKEEASKDKTS